MLTELRIVDLGVISEASIAPHPGLTVVTGETGAGKTMIVSGLGLLSGARAETTAIRVGAQRALVEGSFTALPGLVADRVNSAGGELSDGELLVVRQLSAGGRSRAHVGGTQVPNGVCADVCADLITIHGQSEQLRLAGGDQQREVLDRWAGTGDLLGTFREGYVERREAQAELDRLRAEERTRAQRIDLLRFGLAEIEQVAPLPGEDTALAAEAQRLQSADDLRAAAELAMAGLAGSEDEAGGALSGLAAARKALDTAAADPAAAALAERAAGVGYLVGELAGDLAGYLADLEVQPGRLEQVAARRSALSGLTRKYGATCDEVLDWAEQAGADLTELEGVDERGEVLTERIGVLDTQLAALATELSRRRHAAAAELARLVAVELAALAMPRAQVEFAITPAELGPSGTDQVDMLFSANPGAAPRSLGRIASGGELSRVRLAVEVVLAADEPGSTLVFDEVDAGVGGKVAVEIGRLLARLAQRCQVVVVTHLAQVAAFADRHYVVVKSDDGQVTTSGVAAVTGEDRAAELARMMAGLETTDSSLSHARELLAVARDGR